MTQLLIQAATYNAYLQQSKGVLDLTSWLAPTLDATVSSATAQTDNRRPPDIVAVGFQEALPLHSSLLGLTSTVLDSHDTNIKAAIERAASSRQSPSKPSAPQQQQHETYTLLSKYVIGGIALLVYSLDRTTTPFISDVRVTSAGVGIGGLMGNKGGVAVRVSFDFDGAREDVLQTVKAGLGKGEGWGGKGQITFVCAHLAAHQHQSPRRNRDWRNLVERLVFTKDSQSPHFSPIRSAASGPAEDPSAEGRETQIYDTSALIVMGDLNYRIDLKAPKTLRAKDLGMKIHYERKELLEHDQLRLEREKGRTLQGLSEGVIEFAPTYKYKVGTVDEYKDFNKRIPGWTDRILFSSWADTTPSQIPTSAPSTSISKGTNVLLYRSIPSFVLSDHKPVTALLQLPPLPSNSSVTLATKAPFAIDPAWRTKRLMGWAMDRIVGALWCAVVLAGVGDTKRGAVAWTLLLVGWWWLHKA